MKQPNNIVIKTIVSYKHISTMLLLACILFLPPSCHRSENYSAYRQPVRVEVMVVDSTESVDINTYVGKIEEGSSIQLRFPLGGKVTSVNVRKNQHVKKGDILATTDNTQQQNALTTARATLRQAQDGYERAKKVYEEGALAEVKWVEIQTQLEKAKATAAAAEQQVKDCILRSPESGIIEECDLRVGQQLLPGQTAIRLINTDGVQISFPVPENEISKIHTGTEAEIIVPALSDMRLKGVVGEKDMLSNPLTHSYNAKITISNKSGELMPGMMCKVHLLDQRKTGFVIPSRCVQITQKGISVWIVKSGRAERKSVSSSTYVRGGVLIDNGIEKGDTVIIGGYQKLYEGAEVVNNGK